MFAVAGQSYTVPAIGGTGGPENERDGDSSHEAVSSDDEKEPINKPDDPSLVPPPQVDAPPKPADSDSDSSSSAVNSNNQGQGALPVELPRLPSTKKTAPTGDASKKNPVPETKPVDKKVVSPSDAPPSAPVAPEVDRPQDGKAGPVDGNDDSGTVDSPIESRQDEKKAPSPAPKEDIKESQDAKGFRDNIMYQFNNKHLFGKKPGTFDPRTVWDEMYKTKKFQEKLRNLEPQKETKDEAIITAGLETASENRQKYMDTLEANIKKAQATLEIAEKTRADLMPESKTSKAQKLSKEQRKAALNFKTAKLRLERLTEHKEIGLYPRGPSWHKRFYAVLWRAMSMEDTDRVYDVRVFVSQFVRGSLHYKKGKTRPTRWPAKLFLRTFPLMVDEPEDPGDDQDPQEADDKKGTGPEQPEDPGDDQDPPEVDDKKGTGPEPPDNVPYAEFPLRHCELLEVLGSTEEKKQAQDTKKKLNTRPWHRPPDGSAHYKDMNIVDIRVLNKTTAPLDSDTVSVAKIETMTAGDSLPTLSSKLDVVLASLVHSESKMGTGVANNNLRTDVSIFTQEVFEASDEKTTLVQYTTLMGPTFREFATTPSLGNCANIEEWFTNHILSPAVQEQLSAVYRGSDGTPPTSTEDIHWAVGRSFIGAYFYSVLKDIEIRVAQAVENSPYKIAGGVLLEECPCPFLLSVLADVARLIQFTRKATYMENEQSLPDTDVQYFQEFVARKCQHILRFVMPENVRNARFESFDTLVRLLTTLGSSATRLSYQKC